MIRLDCAAVLLCYGHKTDFLKAKLRGGLSHRFATLRTQEKFLVRGRLC